MQRPKNRRYPPVLCALSLIVAVLPHGDLQKGGKKMSTIALLHSNREYGIELETVRRSAKVHGIADWKTVPDGSLPRNGEEHVSSILWGEDGLRAIANMTHALRMDGYKVTKACGYHCHIDLTGLSKPQFLNVVEFMHVFDEVFFSLLPSARRRNRYCRKFVMTRERLERMRTEMAGISRHLDTVDRYQGCNLLAYRKHNTIEFRYFCGTKDYRKVVHYLALCHAVVEVRKDRKLSKKIDRIKNPTLKHVNRMIKLLALNEETAHFIRGRYTKHNISRQPNRPKPAFNL